jgi:hypothetical protein
VANCGLRAGCRVAQCFFIWIHLALQVSGRLDRVLIEAGSGGPSQILERIAEASAELPEHSLLGFPDPKPRP